MTVLAWSQPEPSSLEQPATCDDDDSGLGGEEHCAECRRRRQGGRRRGPGHTALTFRNNRWLETTGLVTHARRLRVLR